VPLKWWVWLWFAVVVLVSCWLRVTLKTHVHFDWKIWRCHKCTRHGVWFLQLWGLQTTTSKLATVHTAHLRCHQRLHSTGGESQCHHRGGKTPSCANNGSVELFAKVTNFACWLEPVPASRGFIVVLEGNLTYQAEGQRSTRETVLSYCRTVHLTS